MVQTSALPRVVIIGGGFGGLAAAQRLAGVDAQVTLVDRENHHCFQPLLYQVATAALSPADIAWPIRSILHRQSNVLVLMGEVSSVDVRQRAVHLDSIKLPYDYLVLATGVTHAYFGHDEWAPLAPGLKRIEDARVIRRRLLLAFEKAELIDNEAERDRLLTFVIVGGGPTGVEMAGAIAEVARRTLAKDFRRIDPRRSRIALVEAGSRVLAQFPSDLSDHALHALRRMGVEVLLSSPVTECDAGGVVAGGRRIEAATLIWAAGVAASPAAAWIDAEQDGAGRVKVNADLSVPGHPEIFVVGDCAGVTDQNGKPLPGIAPAAKQMGRYAASVIAARIARASAPAPFRYRHYGDLATIGRKDAVVSIGRFRLTGFAGWLFWSIAHIYFLIGAKNRFVVAATWLWSYLTFQRGARLIIEVSPWSETSSEREPPK
ncbi:MAG TPA: NAD(P)/FAD-dependent oxidoreductase [Pseudolabrys sp.]|nr:NAD(P)/FAD-dependent oxidoreductase [Pseudolabrys sp.]